MWVEKYRPKNLDDYFIYPQIKTEIVNWITNFKNQKPNAKNCLFLLGPPGTGKTTIASIILESFGYDVIEFNASDIRTPKLVKLKIEDTLGKKNVLNLMCKKETDIGIIMDEIDGMTTGERGGLSELMKIIHPKKNEPQKPYLTKTPFICISNTIDKKLSELKSKSVFIKFSGVHKMNLIKCAQRITESENIPYNQEYIDIIAKHSQSDYRRFIILMEYIFTCKSELSVEKIDKMLSHFDKKNIDMTYYEATEKMMNKYEPHEIQTYYNQNKSFIPMIFYENFPTYINANSNESPEKKKEAILKIYKNYSDSDLIDYELFINQKWELNELNCFYKCMEPSYIINSMNKKQYNNMNSMNFSTLLNKTSLEYSNVKHDNILKTKLFNLSNSNTMYHFCLLFYNYLKTEDFASIMKLKDTYKLTMEDIDRIPKYLSEKQAAEFNANTKKKLKKLLF
jgi:replication factor C subunit 1